MELYTSDQILSQDDLYDLAGSFSSSGIPFKYQLTSAEMGWLDFIKGKYAIADWISDNLDFIEGVLTFTDPAPFSEALQEDGCYCKAVMLSDDTALQKLFFWLSLDPECE